MGTDLTGIEPKHEKSDRLTRQRRRQFCLVMLWSRYLIFWHTTLLPLVPNSREPKINKLKCFIVTLMSSPQRNR